MLMVRTNRLNPRRRRKAASDLKSANSTISSTTPLSLFFKQIDLSVLLRWLSGRNLFSFHCFMCSEFAFMPTESIIYPFNSNASPPSATRALHPTPLHSTPLHLYTLII
jgi:hypothetical protein